MADKHMMAMRLREYISIFKRLVAETQGFEPWVPF